LASDCAKPIIRIITLKRILFMTFLV
jgi:hypothetical protein